MSESWVLQASPKIGDTLINIRADEPGAFFALIEQVVANADKLAGLGPALSGVAAAAQGLGGQVVQHEATPPAPYQQPVVTSPAPSTPAPPAPAAPAGSTAPICQHGPMTYRSGTGRNGKAWQAYFCPAPKGAPDQCEPKWIR